MDFNPDHFQVVTLDQPGQAALVTKEGQVFYNLESLAGTMAEAVVATIARTPDMTTTERAYLTGQTDVIKFLIRESRGLKGEFLGEQSMKDVITPFDMFGDMP